jgi:hypothetical protein
MENKIPSYLLQPANDHPELSKAKGARLSFLDKTIMNSASAVKSIYVQAENASKENVIQRINPYVKLILMIYFVLIISIVSHLEAQLIITIFIFSLFILARLKILGCTKKYFSWPLYLGL